MDTGSTDGAGRRFLFTIEMAQSSNALLRLLGLFAQRDEIIATIELHGGCAGCRLAIGIENLHAAHAEIIAAKMRNVVAVRSVELTG